MVLVPHRVAPEAPMVVVRHGVVPATHMAEAAPLTEAAPVANRELKFLASNYS